MLSVPAVADEEDSDRDLQVEKIFKPRTQWLGRCRGRVHVLKQGTVRSLDVLSSHGALFLPLSGQHHCRRVLSGKPSTGLGSSKKKPRPSASFRGGRVDLHAIPLSLAVAPPRAFEGIGKPTKTRESMCVAARLGFDTAVGFFVGHSKGPVAELVAILVTFSGDQSSDEWGCREGDDVAFALNWATRLQPHLPCHPGSRQARGLSPFQQNVMLSPARLPGTFDEEPAQSLHGEVPSSHLNQVITLEDSYDAQPHVGSQAAQPSPSHDYSELDYLGPACQTEGSDGSGGSDTPTRTARLAVDPDGPARFGGEGGPRWHCHTNCSRNRAGARS